MCAQGIVQIGMHLKVFSAVEIFEAEALLDEGDALFGQRGDPLLFVDHIVDFRLQTRDQIGELHIVVRTFLGFARDDQRRAGLVDEDVVDLIDDGVVQFALGQPIQICAPCCRAGSQSQTRCWCHR